MRRWTHGRTSVIASVAVSLAALLSSCGGGGGASGGGDREGYPVDVSVIDYSISPGRHNVPAGKLSFVVSNRGPEGTHEFVIIRTDLAADKLPTKPDGSADEMGQGIEILAEIAEFPPGETKEHTLELTAGKYVFICNVVEATTPAKVHYQLGMRTAFTVT